MEMLNILARIAVPSPVAALNALRFAVARHGKAREMRNRAAEEMRVRCLALTLAEDGCREACRNALAASGGMGEGDRAEVEGLARKWEVLS